MILRVSRIASSSVDLVCRYKLFCITQNIRSSSGAVPTHSFIIKSNDDRLNSAGSSSGIANEVVVHSAQEFSNAVSTLFSFEELVLSRQLLDKISMNSVFKHRLIIETHRKLRPELQWIYVWLLNIVVNKADPFPLSIPLYRNPFLARLLESSLAETREFLMLKISDNLSNQPTSTKTQRKLNTFSILAANSTIPDIALALCNILPSYHIEELIAKLDQSIKGQYISRRTPSTELISRLKNFLAHHIDALIAVLAAIDQLPTRYSESYRQKRLLEQIKKQTRLVQSMEAAFARVKEGPRPGEFVGGNNLKRQKNLELEDEIVAIFSKGLQKPITQVASASSLTDIITSSSHNSKSKDSSINHSMLTSSIVTIENVHNIDVKQESLSTKKLPQPTLRGWVPSLMDKYFRAFDTPLLAMLTCEGVPSISDIRTSQEQAHTQLPAQFEQDMNQIVSSSEGYMSPTDSLELDDALAYDQPTLEDDVLYGTYKVMIIQLPLEVNEAVLRKALCRIGAIKHVVVIPSQKVYEGKDSITSELEIEKSNREKVPNSRGSGIKGRKKNLTDTSVIDAISLLKSDTEIDPSAVMTNHTLVDGNSATFNSELFTVSEDEAVESDTDTADKASGNVSINKEVNMRKKIKTNKQRKVAKHNRCDGHAFVWLDETAYHKACRDDFRIFGINIMGKNCPIVAAADLRTLYLEVRQSGWPLLRAQYYLQLMLGCSVNVSDCQLGTLDTSCRPAFVQLRCENHRSAWTVFTLLRSTQFARCNFRVTWVKTSQYRLLGVRMREMRYAYLESSTRTGVRKTQAGATSAHGLLYAETEQEVKSPLNRGEREDR